MKLDFFTGYTWYAYPGESLGTLPTKTFPLARGKPTDWSNPDGFFIVTETPDPPEIPDGWKVEPVCVPEGWGHEGDGFKARHLHTERRGDKFYAAFLEFTVPL